MTLNEIKFEIWGIMKIFLRILLILILGIIFSCQKNANEPVTGTDNNTLLQGIVSENTVPQKELDLNSKIRILAHNMSFALRDKSVCTELSLKFAQADNKEKIIDLEQWMNTKINGKTVAERMAESGFTEKVNGIDKKITKNDLMAIVESIKPGVDFYFPVDKDRETWFNNLNDLLIATPDVSNEWGEFPANDLSGRTIMLSPEKKPSNPVLVIFPCEHHGIHAGSLNQTEQQSIDDGDEGGGGSGGGSGGSGGSSHPPLEDGARIKMHQMKQDVCEEAWDLGDPEIRYSIKNSTHQDYLIKDENPGDKWDCTWHWDGIHHDYGWKTIDHYDFFWHFADYGNYVVYYFYEDDFDTGDQTISYTFHGLKFTFKIGNHDDDMGAKCVDKDDGYLEPGVDQAYDSGDMRFYIDWTNPSN